MSRNCKPKLSEFVEKISDAEDPLNEIDDEYHPKVRRMERAGRSFLRLLANDDGGLLVACAYSETSACLRWYTLLE
jgi:hypothetical protein